MAREQILDIRDEIYNITDPNSVNFDPNKWGTGWDERMFSDLRPSPITDKWVAESGPAIDTQEIRDWEKRNTAPGILQANLVDPIKSAIDYPFEKMAEYDKQSIPAGWQGPGGGAGYASNWRHAANTALLKNKIANTISPYVGDKIGSMTGGVLSLGGGLLHELTSPSKIWEDQSDISDPFLLDAGQSLRLTTDFKEDMLANLFAAYKGKTGIADTKVLESLLEDLSQDDAWSEAFENLIVEGNQKNLINMFKRMPEGWEPEGRWVHPNTRLDKQSWIKKMKERKKYEIPTLRSDTSNIIKKPVIRPNVPGTPIVPTGDGRDFQPQRPTRPGGFTDPGKGSYGPWKASGGMVDKSLSGRSRYL